MDDILAEAERKLHAVRIALIGGDYEARVSAFAELGEVATNIATAQLMLGFEL